MKLEIIPYINWNKSPFKMEDKIPKDVRINLSKRFDVAIANVRGYDEYNNLRLLDGWSISAANNVIFILNPNRQEDFPDNANLRHQRFDAGDLGRKLRDVAIDVWDSETYNDLAKVKGITLDPITGKISYKVI